MKRWFSKEAIRAFLVGVMACLFAYGIYSAISWQKQNRILIQGIDNYLVVCQKFGVLPTVEALNKAIADREKNEQAGPAIPAPSTPPAAKPKK